MLLRGTDDGIHGSNTFFLAMVRGWQGVCVEADTSNFATIETASGRKDGLHLAVAEREGPVEFRTYGPCKQGKGALCGHHAGIQTTQPARGDSPHAGGSLVQVNAVTPSRLLAEHYGPNATIDFVSMDIEGGEFAVLRSWPWHRYCVNVRLPPHLDATRAEVLRRGLTLFSCALWRRCGAWRTGVPLVTCGRPTSNCSGPTATSTRGASPTTRFSCATRAAL
jgi:FkbM family methyltransferase